MTTIDKPFTIAFDGCHKCYVIEDEGDFDIMKGNGYKDEDFLYFVAWDEFMEFYKVLCPCRFLSNAKLTKNYIEQCEA